MRAHAARAFACAVLIAALACGGEGDDGASNAARETSEAQPANEAAPAAAASEAEPSAGEGISESAVAPETDGEADGRIAELLDLEPEGAGLDALIRAARDDPDPIAREAAVIALGDSEDSRALDALIAATDDRDSRVVLAAIDQLSWFDDRRAQDAIRRLAESPDAQIAAAAADEIEE